jgi:hypothetical protein
MPDKREELHRVLVDKQLYTKDYESFKEQFSTPEKQEALYGALFERKLYTKDLPSFQQQFFNGQEQPLSELLDAQPVEQQEQKTIKPTTPGLFADVEKGPTQETPLSEQVKEQPTVKQGKPQKMGRTESAMAIFNQRFYGLPGEISKAIAIGGNAIDRYVLGQDVKAEDNPLYKAGQWYQDAVKEISPNNPEYQGELQESVAQAMGDLAGLVIGGGAARMASKGAAQALPAAAKAGSKSLVGATAEASKNIMKGIASPEGLIGATQMGVSEFEQAIDGGATEDEAFDIFIKNASIGSVLERIPVQLFWKRLDTVTGGGVKTLLKKGFSGGMEEATTEILQQAYANKKASEVYDTTRSILDGMGESGGIGFGLGFVLNAMGVRLRSMKKNVSKKEAKAIQKTIDMVDQEIATLEKTIEETEKLQKDAIKEGYSSGDVVDLEVNQQQESETEEVTEPTQDPVVEEIAPDEQTPVEPEETPAEPVKKAEIKKRRVDIINRTPTNVRSAVRQWLLQRGQLTSESIKRETGFKGHEIKSMIGIANNKTGVSIERASEIIKESLPQGMLESVSDSDIRNELIDIVMSEQRTEWLANQDQDTRESTVGDYETWARSQMSQEELSELSEYENSEAFYTEAERNADQLAEEYDNYVNSNEYQQYIEETYADQIAKSEEDAVNQEDKRDTVQEEDPGSIEAKEKLNSLNPSGKAIQSLKAAQESGINTDLIESKIKFIDNLRKKHQNLSDAHENEIFDALNLPNANRDNISKKVSKAVSDFTFKASDKIGLLPTQETTVESKRAEIDQKINKVTKRLREIAKLPKTNKQAQVEKSALTKELNRLNDQRQKTLNKVEATKDAPQSKLFDKKPKKASVKDIKSKNLTHVTGLNMGQNQAEGTYLSTEEGNRYAKEGDKVQSATVNIENPIELTLDEFGELQRKLIEENFPDKKTIDDLSDTESKQLAKIVTKELKDQGFDSIYFPASDVQEGELVVFDKGKVEFEPKQPFEDTGSPQGAPASPVIGTNYNPGKADVKAGDRIQPAPLVRQDEKGRIIKPKPIQQIWEDLEKNLKKLTKNIGALKYKATPIPGRKNIIGAFDPFNRTIATKAANDLDTTAHEMGHALDKAYGLQKDIPDSNSAMSVFLNELSEQGKDTNLPFFLSMTRSSNLYGQVNEELKPFSKHGSKPPPGHPNPQEYELKEGIAEWIRAYIANPVEAIENAPVFHAWYQLKVPKDAKQAMEEFSIDFRSLEGASGFDLANASLEVIKQKTMLERLKETRHELLEALKPQTRNPQDFKLTWGDKLNQKFVDSTKPYIMTVKYAAAVGNIDLDVVLPENNPLVMARLFLGRNGKVENFLEKGMVHFNSDKRVIDKKTGEAVSLPWMLDPFSRTDRATFDEERQMMMSYAVAKRTLELPIKDMENQISDALSQGQIIPSSVLYSNQRLYDKFYDQNEENRQAIYDKNDYYNKNLKDRAKKTESKINQAYANKRAKLEAIKRKQQIEIDSQRQKYYDQKGEIPEKKRLEKLRIFERQATEARETFDQEIDKLETERFKALQRLHGKVDAQMDEVLKSTKMARIKRSRRFYTGIGAGVVPEARAAQRVIDEFESLTQDKKDRINEALRRYRKFSDTILRYMVDSGRMSEDAYKAIRDNNEEYIRLERFIQADPGKEMEAFTGPGTGKNIGNVSEPIKSIRGSSQLIKNPYEALLGLMHKVIIESDRNYVLKSYVDFMQEAKRKAGDSAGKISEIIAPGSEKDANTITVFIDGKKKYYKMDKDIYRSMKGIVGQLYSLPPIIRFFPKLLRASVTNNPVFAGRNLLRDYQTMMVVSDNVKSIGDIIPKKLRKIGDLEPSDAFEVFGAGQGGYHLLNEDFYNKTLEETAKKLVGVKGNILVHAGDFAKHATQSFGRLSARSEKVTRMQEFKNSFRKSKAKGMDDYNAGLKAAYDARSLMDFAVVGEWMNVVNQLIPFTNAKIQGLRVAKRGFVKHPFLFTAKAGLTIMLPQILLRAMYSDEEDERYRQLPEYQRNMYWNIPTDTGWLMIPKPHDIAVMGTMADMTWDKAMGHKPNYGGFNTALFALMPFSRSDMAGPMRTFVELSANKDFFRDSSIVPEYEDKKALELRNYEYASRLGKFIGEPIGVDPRKIDHFIRGTTSYFGSQAMRISDMGREDKKRNMAEITGFYKEEPVYSYVDVQWAQEKAQMYGLETEQYYMYLRWMIRAYSDLESDDQKKAMAKSIRELSGFVRNLWESYGIKEYGAGDYREDFIKETRKAAAKVTKGPLFKELKEQREMKKKATGRK